MVKYLQYAALDSLSNFLHAQRVGDQVLSGQLGAFSLKREGAERRRARDMLEAIEKRHGALATDLGSMSDISARNLLVDLIGTMNASFPDYDFSDLRPENFRREPLDQVIHTVNSHLSELVESVNPTFVEDLWSGINPVIDVSKCEVYRYIPEGEEDPFSRSTLWAFNYFFFNREKKRILLFTCMARSRFHAAEDDDEVDDPAYIEEEEQAMAMAELVSTDPRDAEDGSQASAEEIEQLSQQDWETGA